MGYRDQGSMLALGFQVPITAAKELCASREVSGPADLSGLVVTVRDNGEGIWSSHSTIMSQAGHSFIL